MILPWFFFKDKKKGFIILFLILGSLLLSFFDKKTLKLTFEEWESKWCFLGVLSPLVIVILKLINY